MDASAFSGMGDEDIALVIQMLQEDGQEAMSLATGGERNPEGMETDAQVAFRLFLEEVTSAERFSTDRRMTRSLQQAVCNDGDALVQSQHEEQVARDDRNISLALNNGARRPAAPEGTLAVMGNDNDDDLLDRLTRIYVTGIDDVGSDSDIPGDDDDDTVEEQRRRCEACRDLIHPADLAKAECEHEYCRACLTHLFRDAMTDESLFPPRCCREPLVLDEVQPFLDPDVAQQFRRKALEFSTPNRTYCHDPDCAAFIPPANCVDSVATCEECRDGTCMTCKGASHDGDCPEDEQLQQVIQLAREQGWQRCRNCRGMVELNFGCNHMTCRCGFQFCYMCAARWKTCHCDQWDERRLYARAAQIDARDHPDQNEAAIVNQPNNAAAGVVEPARGQRGQEREHQARGRTRQERMQTIVRTLVNHHECDHEHWRNRDGPETCEECHDVMPIFIYECRQCHIMACRRCRNNRL